MVCFLYHSRFTLNNLLNVFLRLLRLCGYLICVLFFNVCTTIFLGNIKYLSFCYLFYFFADFNFIHFFLFGFFFLNPIKG